MEIYNTEGIYFRISDSDKDIYLKDKTDACDGTSAYSTKKRPFKKAKAFLLGLVKSGRHDGMTFHGIVALLDGRGLSMHTYCAMD